MTQNPDMNETDWDAVERQRRERNAAITAAHIADLKRREQARPQAEIAIATSIGEPRERSEADAAQLKARLNPDPPLTWSRRWVATSECPSAQEE